MNTLFIKKILIFLASVMLVVFSNLAFSEGQFFTGSSEYSIQYSQKDFKSLDVNVRPHGNVNDLAATIIAGKPALPPNAELMSYPREGDKTAILFLMDVSSDKTRKSLIKKNIQQLQTILETGKAHQQFGLATFGEKLTVLSPVGTDKDEIRTTANTIIANENETLLYQHIGEAIDILDQQAASRRVLVVFSDGKTEDQPEVYNDKYVIEKTKKKNIIIIGLAFPERNRRGHQVRYYQSLKHLADTTGGEFLKANTQGDLRQDNMESLLATTDKGGYWNFNLTPLFSAKFKEKPTPILRIKNSQQIIDIPININFPKQNALTKTQQLMMVAGIALFLLGLLLFLLKRNKNKPEKTYAYIDSLDGNDRYKINKKTYTIGRNDGNDLMLANSAVSSFHAQIHLSREGDFIITDLNSMNKVYINDSSEAISSSAVLEDSDLITIGEVRLRFHK